MNKPSANAQNAERKMAYQLNMYGDTTRDERELRTSYAKPRGSRQQSRSEREAIYRVWGTGLVRCLHERSYFVECTKCKRTRSEAEANFKAFAAKITNLQAKP